MTRPAARRRRRSATGRHALRGVGADAAGRSTSMLGGSVGRRSVRDERAGTWVGVVDGVGHGDRYRFRLDGGEPLADPASGWQPDGVHGPSAVVDPSPVRVDRRRTGAASRSPTPCSTSCTSARSRRRARSTAPSASSTGWPRLGVTTIELMPVNAFPGGRNWGYDGVFPSAVQDVLRRARRRSPASSTPPTAPGSASCSTSSTTTSGRRAASHAGSAPYFTDAVPHAVGRRPSTSPGPAATSSGARSSRAPAAGSRTSTSTGCGSTPSHADRTTRRPRRSSRS